MLQRGEMDGWRLGVRFLYMFCEDGELLLAAWRYVTCSFFLIEKDLPLEDVFYMFYARMPLCASRVHSFIHTLQYMQLMPCIHGHRHRHEDTTRPTRLTAWVFSITKDEMEARRMKFVGKFKHPSRGPLPWGS